jgi:excinuclease ABC subunit A
MKISIRGAREHNLQNVALDIGGGLTVVTGVSGSGKTSLVFDTLYHEARRRFLEVFSVGAAAGRLPPANVDEIIGLGPAVAVGQNLLNRNPGSTLATASGLHPFLRLLFTHFGEQACPRCSTPLRVFSEDELVAALAGLAENGPVEIRAPLLRAIPGSHATLLRLFAAQFPLSDLIVDGCAWDGRPLEAALAHNLEVRVGALSAGTAALEIRSLLQDAQALGAQAVIARSGERDRVYGRAPVCLECGAWFGELRAVDFHSTCPYCQGQAIRTAPCAACAGTGLPPQAAAVRWQGLRFPDLLALTVETALERFSRAGADLPSPRLAREIHVRLAALERVGLGYLGLNRSAPTLSRGEAQRVRLAVTLVSRLEDMLHVLDEPTIGLHPVDVQRLMPAFRDLAGPVVFVEHERAAAAAADWAVDMGPGAGRQGGQLVFQGTPAELWQAETASGRCFSLRERAVLPHHRPAPAQFLTIRQADLRNLQHIDVAIPLGRLVVVTGVSGSGKSTLVEDVLCATLASGAPTGCAGLDGPSLKAVMVDQSPIGRNPRSNPTTYTGLANILRDLFSAVTGLSPSHFSFNRPEGACPTCGGLGAVEVTMRYLPSEWVLCADCAGERFSEEVLTARARFGEVDLSIAGFLNLSVNEACSILAADETLAPAVRAGGLRILRALQEIGLGYLSLGQPSTTLSGGEAQRVKLAKFLSQKSLSGQLLILDEPSTGLHPRDLHGLLVVLDRLVRTGATVLVVEHNTEMIQAADWVIDLGPGSGPRGGRLLYAGPPHGLLSAPGSLTGQALAAEAQLRPGSADLSGAGPGESASIAIRGARAHNLRGVDVDFPKGALTVVTGVSGSGKSSLVGDVLEVEARRRFLETLSLYERQGLREGPEAEVDSVTGLGVALTIAPERLVYSRRATVGTATGLLHHLGVLLSAAGERPCPQCGGRLQRRGQPGQPAGMFACPACGFTTPLPRPQDFSGSTYAGMCKKCHGVGTLQTPAPAKLIIAPHLPVCAGAMYSPGFFPNGYLGKPLNHGYYYVQALGQRYGFDPHRTPWDQMTPAAQQAFLFGDPEPMQVHSESRTGRSSTHTGTFPGFYGFIRDWDVGGTYTDTVACPDCGGSRLRPEFLAVRLAERNIDQLIHLPLVQLHDCLRAFQSSAGSLPAGLPPGALSSLRAAINRLQFLVQVGLAYLHLDRPAGTLSAGEVQRIRLAGLLGSGLTSLTLLLDEPSRGLHPGEVGALLDALRSLSRAGNTVIVVEHDPLVIRSADYLVDMGPGGGRDGGRLLAAGPPEQVLSQDTLTARWMRGERRQPVMTPRKSPVAWLEIAGARANNLKGERVRLPLGVLAGVCGVSGSGKSTLIIDTLGRALAPRKQTTSVAYEPLDPGEHDAILGAPARTLVLDQSRAGVTSPAAALGLIQPLREAFAGTAAAHALGLTAEDFSPRCTSCGGSGRQTLDMAFLPDMHIPCETCQGTGFQPEAWQVRLREHCLPEVLGLTLDDTADLYGGLDPRLDRPLQVAREVGLGYLVLRQPGQALSGGEAQRLKIAEELCRKTPAGSLYILDEPTVGQHLEDVSRLAGVLRRLVDAGGSVLVVEHHIHLLAACDWLVELGPCGGPEGGWVVASGTPETLAGGSTPTAPYLRQFFQEGV